jgi:uncharacterized membrane protein
MALKFNCDKCGGEIIVKYVKPGEIAKCPGCGAKNVVPADGEGTEEEPDYLGKKKGETRSVEHTQGNAPVKDEVSKNGIINPPKRFATLDFVAKVLKVLALISLIFSVISAVAICAVSEGSASGSLMGLMIILYGVVIAVTIFVYAEVILLLINVEEHTRVTREIAVHRYLRENDERKNV